MGVRISGSGPRVDDLDDCLGPGFVDVRREEQTWAAWALARARSTSSRLGSTVGSALRLALARVRYLIEKPGIRRT